MLFINLYYNIYYIIILSLGIESTSSSSRFSFRKASTTVIALPPCEQGSRIATITRVAQPPRHHAPPREPPLRARVGKHN
ncbi:hypothetical protein ACSQ67_019973 [Phaseolus vulgaris]